MNFSISILPFSHYIFIFINELMIFTTIVFVCLQQLHWHTRTQHNTYEWS